MENPDRTPAYGEMGIIKVELLLSEKLPEKRRQELESLLWAALGSFLGASCLRRDYETYTLQISSSADPQTTETQPLMKSKRVDLILKRS